MVEELAEAGGSTSAPCLLAVDVVHSRVCPDSERIAKVDPAVFRSCEVGVHHFEKPYVAQNEEEPQQSDHVGSEPQREKSDARVPVVPQDIV